MAISNKRRMKGRYRIVECHRFRARMLWTLLPDGRHQPLPGHDARWAITSKWVHEHDSNDLHVQTLLEAHAAMDEMAAVFEVKRRVAR